MAGRRKTVRGYASLMADQFAYRNYLVKPGFDGMWHISRDGHHIGSEKTAAAAKATIDLLTGSVGERRRRRGRDKVEMRLKYEGDRNGICAWIENVPSNFKSSAELYDYLESAAPQDAGVQKWLNKVGGRPPGWWQGTTFVAVDEC